MSVQTGGAKNVEKQNVKQWKCRKKTKENFQKKNVKDESREKENIEKDGILQQDQNYIFIVTFS
jgi:hypothetical protein